MRKIEGNGFCHASIEGELVIPENCLTIGHQAFCGTNLTKIVLPSKLEYIEAEAFRSMKSLRELTIPQYVNYIGEYAFSMRTLTNVYLGNTSADIGNCAFGHNLITHNLPDSYRCGPA